AGENSFSMKRGNIYLHDPAQHAAMEKKFGFPLRSAFGMTEIGFGTFVPLEAAEKTGSGTCGVAAPFRAVMIADTQGRQVPKGTIGELLIKGPGIMLGYHNNPD